MIAKPALRVHDASLNGTELSFVLAKSARCVKRTEKKIEVHERASTAWLDRARDPHPRVRRD
jgi:hypothetical protein